MLDGILEVNVLNNDLVGLSARGRRDRHDNTIREVPRPKKIHGGSIPVVRDAHVASEVNVRQVKIIERGALKKLGANRKQRNIEGPIVLQSRLNGKNLPPTDQ